MPWRCTFSSVQLAQTHQKEELIQASRNGIKRKFHQDLMLWIKELNIESYPTLQPPPAGKPVDKIGTNAGLSTAQHAAALFIPAMPQSGRLFSMPSLRMQWIEKQRKKHVFPREAADLLRRLIQKNKRHSKTKNIFFPDRTWPVCGCLCAGALGDCSKSHAWAVP
ncbi:hypothetical protein [uncultured Ottowia sp.]|uniref:hypothetical protein n=1 Tax=uncultured Ottowia sp. TaxID=543067 RepID=UPI0025931676|nr:hypothetical protein [uncultured Ottowia sp.]